MHYKNGRPVEIGDFVVGISHNSEGRIVFGVVLEVMPRQGPCNIRIARIERTSCKVADEREISHIRLQDDAQSALVTDFDNYGDAAKFIKCEDGLRLASAALLGKWDSNYIV